jgi:hypothetical protein
MVRIRKSAKGREKIEKKTKEKRKRGRGDGN